MLKGKCELHPERFIEHSKKIDRWISDQCDVLIAYFYEEIPDSLTSEIRRLKSKKTKTIIHICNPELAKELHQQISFLDEKQQRILLGLKDGRTYKSLGDELGVSATSIMQYSRKAVRILFKKDSRLFN